MKKLILATTMALAAVAAYGQGTIVFNNTSTQWSPADNTHLMRWSDAPTNGPAMGANLGYAPVASLGLASGGLASSNAFPSLRAQMYWGPNSASSVVGMTGLTAAPVPLRASTSANAGSWNGATRTVDAWVTASTYKVGVLVWDTTQAADGQAALAAILAGTYSGLFGESQLFSYTVPDPSQTPAPSAYFMTALQAFTIGNIQPVPEPGTFALGGLVLGALAIFRRRKQ